MNVSEMPLSERLAYIAALGDPLDRLSLLEEVRDDIREAKTEADRIRREAVIELRSDGMTLRRIGETLGVTAQRVEQIERGRAR